MHKRHEPFVHKRFEPFVHKRCGPFAHKRLNPFVHKRPRMLWSFSHLNLLVDCVVLPT